MIDFLREEGVSERILTEITAFREFYHVNESAADRIPVPQYRYYGAEIWEEAASDMRRSVSACV